MRNIVKLGILGAAVLVLDLAWWLASPLFVTKQVSEALPTTSVSKSPELPDGAISQPAISPTPLPEGKFQGFDASHTASGTARIITADGKTYVRFEDDFSVTNGPDLFVYLGNNNKYDPNALLGKLKGNVGSQNYEIPATISIDNYSEVWVWCRAFPVPFGKAVLK